MIYQRNRIADLLKGIAVLFMVQVHQMELFANTDIYNSVLGKISLFMGATPVAPVFLILLGYFISQTQKTTQQLLFRGLKIFMLGMLLNIALNFNLIISVSKGLFHLDIFPYIFGVDILQCAGISIIVIAFIKKVVLNKNSLFLILFVLAIVIAGELLLNVSITFPFLKYFSSFFWGSAHWSYFPILPWLAYPLTGLIIHQLKIQSYVSVLNKAIVKIGVIAFFLLYIALTVQYANSITSNLQAYYHHDILFFIWVIFFLSLYFSLIFVIGDVLKNTMIFNYLNWLGKNVTLIYVIQWILIGNVATEIYKTINNPYYLGFLFIATVLIISGLCYGLLYLKKIILSKP